MGSLGGSGDLADRLWARVGRLPKHYRPVVRPRRRGADISDEGADSLRSRTFYSKEYTAQFPGKDGMSGHGVIIPVVAYSWTDHCYQYDSATSRTLRDVDAADISRQRAAQQAQQKNWQRRQQQQQMLAQKRMLEATEAQAAAKRQALAAQGVGVPVAQGGEVIQPQGGDDDDTVSDAPVRMTSASPTESRPGIIKPEVRLGSARQDGGSAEIIKPQPVRQGFSADELTAWREVTQLQIGDERAEALTAEYQAHLASEAGGSKDEGTCGKYAACIKALLTDVEGALFTNVRKGMKLGMLEVLGSINRPFLAGEAGPHAQHGVPAMRQFIAFLKMKGI